MGRKSKEKEEKAYLKAGSVATQALSSLRTVLAFGGEEKEQERSSNGLVFPAHIIILYCRFTVLFNAGTAHIQRYQSCRQLKELSLVV